MITKKNLLSLLSFILVLVMLASCQTPAPNSGESGITTELITEPAPNLPDGLVLAGPDFTTVCTVTYPKSNQAFKEVAQALADYINKLIPNANLAVAESDAATTEYQIAICEPDSEQTKRYSLVLDGKIVKLAGLTKDAVIDAANYFKVFCMKDGYVVIDEALNYASSLGPAVISQFPENYYYYEDVYTPSLAYSFPANSVDTTKSRLIIDGVDVTDKADWSKGTVTYTDFTVDAGDHNVLLALSSQRGDIEVLDTMFTCGDGSVMNLYAGEIHAHTSDSDGEMTVKDAYTYARDVAKLDFFAVTDHSGSFTNEKYRGTHITNADSFNNPGTFVALYGYEQTYNINSGYFGHLNTINHSALTTTSLDLTAFYREMIKTENVTVMFNHPGYTWGNFAEYTLYSPEIDAVLNLSEIKNTSAANYEYALSLTKGWHVSPVYNEDNHTANWGTGSDACGYVLAPSLTRQNILEAFNKNRTYTTSDKSLKIYYQINGEWMGSRLNNPDNLHFSLKLSTEKANGLGSISIIAEDGVIVKQIAAGSAKNYTVEFDLPPHYDYYYIKVISDGIWAYTAPIWIENREALTVDSITQELVVDNNSDNDYRISAEITNHTDKVMTDVYVDFNLSTTAGYTVPKATPMKRIEIGEIAPGATITVYTDIKYNYTAPRVYVDVKGKQDGKDYGAVSYMEISDLYFSEILPYTTNGGTDAYEYFELYNNSDSVVDLATCSIRYYSKAGAKAADLQANTWTLKGKIQPHSTMVLWVVSETNKLTVDDFNKHFGTNLVEGKDIVMIKGINIPHSKPVQLELLRNTYIIGRVWYNWEKTNDIFKDKAIVYNYPTDYTITAKVDKNNMTPTPGALADGQMPKTVTQ